MAMRLDQYLASNSSPATPTAAPVRLDQYLAAPTAPAAPSFDQQVQQITQDNTTVADSLAHGEQLIREKGLYLAPHAPAADGSQEFTPERSVIGPQQLSPSDRLAIIGAYRKQYDGAPITDQTFGQMQQQETAQSVSENSPLQDVSANVGQIIGEPIKQAVGLFSGNAGANIQDQMNTAYPANPESNTTAVMQGVVKPVVQTGELALTGGAAAPYVMGGTMAGQSRINSEEQRRSGTPVSGGQELTQAAMQAALGYFGGKIGVGAVTQESVDMAKNAILNHVMNYARTAGIAASDAGILNVVNNAVDAVANGRPIDENVALHGTGEAMVAGGVMGATGRGLHGLMNRGAAPLDEATAPAAKPSIESQAAVQPAPVAQPTPAAPVSTEVTSGSATTETPAQQPGPVSSAAPVDELTQVKQQLQEERRLRRTDDLTGAPNRIAYEEQSSEALKQADANKEHVAIAESDLGNFKVANDELGHDVGDKLLKAEHEALSEALRAEPVQTDTGHTRPADMVGSHFRVGGDEFPSILRGVQDEDTARTVLKRASDIFDKKASDIIGDKLPKEAYPFISWGVEIRKPGDTRSIEELRKAADAKVIPDKQRIKAERGIPDTREGLSGFIKKAREAKQGIPVLEKTAATGNFGPSTPSINDPNFGKGSDLQAATDMIKRAVPEKAGLTSQMRQAFSVGKTMTKFKEGTSNAVKNVVGAYDGLRGSLASMFRAYKAKPAGSDGIDGIMRRWSGADNRSAIETNDFVKTFKEHIPDSTTREAMSIYNEAGGDPKTLAQWAKDIAGKSSKHAAAFEAATKLSDEHKAIAEQIGARNDAALNESVAAGVLKDGVDNYMMHLWKKSSAALRKVMGEGSYNSLRTKPTFGNKRSIATLHDGIMKGMEPQSMDAADLTAAHERAFRQALASRAVVKQLSEATASDGRPMVAVSPSSAQAVGNTAGVTDAYMVRPNTRAAKDFADYRVIDHPALRGWKWAGKDESGKPIFVQGDMLVHPDAYRMLKNNLTPSAIRNFEVTIGDKAYRPGEAALNAGSELKHAVLSFSGFHQTTLGVHAAEHGVMPAGMPKIDLNNPTHAALIDHGLMVAHHNALETFGEGVASGGLITKIPGIGPAYHAYTNYLFGDYLPRIKMAMATHALERNTQRYSGTMSKDQILNLTADQANAAFGGLNYRALGRNKTFQDVMRSVLMAPDFLEARGRFVGQALKGGGREQSRALIVGAAAMYSAGAVLNKLLDDDWHLDKPFTLVYHGKEYQLRTVQGDLYHLISDPMGFARTRLSPLAQFGMNALNQRDQFGRKQSFPAAVKDAAMKEAPIPVQPFTRKSGDSDAEKAIETFWKMIGINQHKTKNEDANSTDIKWRD